MSTSLRSASMSAALFGAGLIFGTHPAVSSLTQGPEPSPLDALSPSEVASLCALPPQAGLPQAGFPQADPSSLLVPGLAEPGDLARRAFPQQALQQQALQQQALQQQALQQQALQQQALQQQALQQQALRQQALRQQALQQQALAQAFPQAFPQASALAQALPQALPQAAPIAPAGAPGLFGAESSALARLRAGQIDERAPERRDGTELLTDLAFRPAAEPGTLPLPDREAVRRRLERYVSDPSGRTKMETWLRRRGRYRDVIAAALAERSLPAGLEAVAFVESDLFPTARSTAGAVGLWQLMPATARAYGLTVEADYDERRSIWRATEAATHHLADLYEALHSWPLALAAYNAGYGRVREAMERTGSRDFWVLAERGGSIPESTVGYVEKVLAIAAILRDAESFGFALEETEAPLDAVRLEAPGGTPLALLARAAGIPEAELRTLNPEILGEALPEREVGVTLYVPRRRAVRARVVLPTLLRTAPSRTAPLRGGSEGAVDDV